MFLQKLWQTLLNKSGEMKQFRLSGEGLRKDKIPSWEFCSGKRRSHLG